MRDQRQQQETATASDRTYHVTCQSLPQHRAQVLDFEMNDNMLKGDAVDSSAISQTLPDGSDEHCHAVPRTAQVEWLKATLPFLEEVQRLGKGYGYILVESEQAFLLRSELDV